MEGVKMILASGLVVLVAIGFVSCGTITFTNPDSNNKLTPAVAEDTAVGALGVTLAATFSSATAASNAFTILDQETSGMFSLSNTYELELNTGFSLDYETKAEYIFTIKATDDEAATATVTCTMSITDVNEAPVFGSTSGYNFNVKSGSGAATAVGTVTATDADATATGNTVTYSITAGNTDNVFTVDQSTGAVTIASGKTVSTSTSAAYSLTMQAQSSGTGTPSATTDVRIGVCASGAASIKTAGIFVTMLLFASTIFKFL